VFSDDDLEALRRRLVDAVRGRQHEVGGEERTAAERLRAVAGFDQPNLEPMLLFGKYFRRKYWIRDG
jgi:hypothetical protein